MVVSPNTQLPENIKHKSEKILDKIRRKRFSSSTKLLENIKHKIGDNSRENTKEKVVSSSTKLHENKNIKSEKKIKRKYEG